jgi:hypothetical protein
LLLVAIDAIASAHGKVANMELRAAIEARATGFAPDDPFPLIWPVPHAVGEWPLFARSGRLQARSASLSLGDEAVAALETLAQRRRLSFRKAGDTERVNSNRHSPGSCELWRKVGDDGVNWAA